MALRKELFLFPEDFGHAPRVVGAVPMPVPEPAGPLFDETDLASAREAGFAAGHAQGHAAAMADIGAQVARILTVLAERLGDARQEAARVAEESAASLARLLFEAVGAGYPGLRERFGEAEVRRFARAVLPALVRQPQVEVRVHPALAAAVAEEIAALPAQSGPPPTVAASEAVPHGDAAIIWHDGSALRDAAAAWSAVAAALHPLGLLGAAAVSTSNATG